MIGSANTTCNLLTGEGMRKTCAVGKKRNITGELQKRRGSGKRKTAVVLKLNSMRAGDLAEWGHQEGQEDPWDHVLLWRELVTW